MTGPTPTDAGLGWPTVEPVVSRETPPTDLSPDDLQTVGLGWPE